MLSKENYRFLRGGLLIVGSLVFSYALTAQATSRDDIVYPVEELAGCKNETECRAFCDKPGNITSCVNFAEKHDLISKEEVEIARKFIAVGSKGPGGCTGQDSCEAYCDDISNINECLSFAQQNGLMEPEELEEAKKVQAALAKGAKLPGGCTKKESCEVYCENPDNMRECITFAEAAGFIPPDELADAKKALVAIEKGVKPPRCRGKEDCDAYCSEPENFEQCISFAEAAGFVSPEDAKMARKTGGKGPGNCRGKEECEKFCEDELNGEVCFNFAKDHGLISEEELRNAEEGKQKIQEALNNAPPKVIECLNDTLGNAALDKLKEGSSMPNRKVGDSIRQCFETMMSDDFSPGVHGTDSEQMRPREGSPSNFTGPGGCKNEAECRAFCEANPEQCQGFGSPPGVGVPQNESRESFQQEQPSPDDFHQGLPPGLPTDGFREGERSAPIPQEFQRKYEEEFQRQYQEKYNEIQQLYQAPDTNQYEQQHPPTQSPSDETPPPAPQSRYNMRSLFGNILNALNDILR